MMRSPADGRNILFAVDLLGLLKWRQQPNQLKKTLAFMMKVDGEEVVKVTHCLCRVQECYFRIDIFGRPTKRSDSVSFHKFCRFSAFPLQQCICVSVSMACKKHLLRAVPARHLGRLVQHHDGKSRQRLLRLDGFRRPGKCRWRPVAFKG